MKSKRTYQKTFRVISISENTNSFGLTGHILVATDGETWEVAKSRYGDVRSQWKRGQDIIVPVVASEQGEFIRFEWGSLSCEIPCRKNDCPDSILKEIYA